MHCKSRRRILYLLIVTPVVFMALSAIFRGKFFTPKVTPTLGICSGDVFMIVKDVAKKTDRKSHDNEPSIFSEPTIHLNLVVGACVVESL